MTLSYSKCLATEHVLQSTMYCHAPALSGLNRNQEALNVLDELMALENELRS